MNSSQQGLAQVVQFFNVRASSTDVTSAIGITTVLMNIAILIVSVLGFVALAIWVTRIGVDILLITLRGTDIAEKMSKLGTSTNVENYKTVADYLKKNLVEIVLVVVLVALMVTGWLWRIFAMALQGIGGILNFLLGLDFDGLLSSQDAEIWRTNMASQPPAAIKNEYDDNLELARTTLNEIYSDAMVDLDNDHPLKQDALRRYGAAVGKANALKTVADRAGVGTQLNLVADYFTRHQTASVCNSNFIGQGVAQEAVQTYSGGSVSCLVGNSR